MRCNLVVLVARVCVTPPQALYSHMPKPLAVCGVCLASARCRDDRKFATFGSNFLSGQGNTHRCADNVASAKQCTRIATCTADELRRDAAYGARLRDYATALETSVRRYLKREMLWEFLGRISYLGRAFAHRHE